MKVLIFTGEILNERLWVDAIDAGCNGIILKSGEMLTRSDIMRVLEGKKYVFNQPILEKVVERFCESVRNVMQHNDAMIRYEIDEYDEASCAILPLATLRSKSPTCVQCLSE